MPACLRLLGILAALLVTLAAPAAAHAASNLETAIADDNVLFRENPVDAAKTVASWSSVGIDNVRLFVQWSQVSPDAARTRPPAGFDVANPLSTGYNWSALD